VPHNTFQSKPLKKKEKDDKLKLFLVTGEKRAKYIMRGGNISMEEFRQNIKGKIRSSTDNFEIEIASGKYKNQKIKTEKDIQDYLVGQSEDIDLKIT